MNTYVRSYNKNEPLNAKWVDFRRPRDKKLVIAACMFVVFTYSSVWWTEEREKRRKHTSIEKDIERERWRADQLGLGAPEADDGFADTYLAGLGENRLVRDHSEFLPENQKIVG